VGEHDKYDICKKPLKQRVVEWNTYISQELSVLIFQYVRFEVFTAVTMKNGVFWDVTPCGSCKNQRFRGT
jgi:hypothetical protein